jgi:hypothetical protein
LNPHEGEHVGQNHDRCPAAAQTEVDDLGNLQELRIKRFDRVGEGGPAAELGGAHDEKAQNDNTTHQQDELDNAHPGGGFQAAGADIEPDDKGQKDSPVGCGNAGNDVEEGAGRHQLYGGVEDGVEHGGGDDQPAQRLVVIIIGIHVAGGDKPIALAHEPGAFGEERAGDGNGQHVKRCKRIG